MTAAGLLRAWTYIALASFAWGASAHEVRPAYLELREQPGGTFDVLWKTPARGDYRLALEPSFSGQTANATAVASRATRDAAVQRWKLHAREHLRGQTVSIAGLDATMTDALVRIEFADGDTWTKRLTPQEPAATIPLRASALDVAGEYLRLGVEHILLGIDHLLFVLALLTLTRARWPLVKAITAFTVAHSITLALATVGFVHVPRAPVEAVIALSVAVVAAEILRVQRGRAGMAANVPWLVAFAFGLLHGFGFAGALAEIGLPATHIPLALLLFNVGVEIGQLLFIAGVLGTLAAVRRIDLAPPQWAPKVAPYAIGSMAMFWVMERVAAF
jgi:hydrogenase/urease accessory protein HupE